MKESSMKSLPNPSLIDSDSPEWTSESFARAKPTHEFFTEDEWAKLTNGHVKITEIKTKPAMKVKSYKRVRVSNSPFVASIAS
jgi:hypothetical protein